MKGIAISINIVIIIIVAVIALSAIGVFFGSSSFQSVSDIETQRIFSSGCARYCSSDIYQTLSNAVGALKNDPQFVAACTKLGYIEKGSEYLNRCLSKCGNCNFNVTQTDLNLYADNRNNLINGG